MAPEMPADNLKRGQGRGLKGRKGGLLSIEKTGMCKFLGRGKRQDCIWMRGRVQGRKLDAAVSKEGTG